MLAEVGLNRSNHAKIEEVNAVLPPHEVAGVGVCMEKPLHEDLLVKAFQELASGLGALQTLRGLRNRSALDLFHHQEPGSGQLPVHAGDSEAIVAFEHAPHPLDVFGFLTEVEFAAQ